MTKKLEDLTPYTYLLSWTATGMSYYGVRWANTLPPSNDLWKEYYTSSKYVSTHRKLHGDPDIIEIDKIFQTKEEAANYETQFLIEKFHDEWELWLNKNISGAIIHDDEIIEKIRASNIGKHDGPISNAHKNNISVGMKESLSKLTLEEKTARMKNSCCAPESYTKERSENISTALRGKKKSTEHCINMSKSKRVLIDGLTDNELKSKYGKQNKGKTWRLIDGKRQWFIKGE